MNAGDCMCMYVCALLCYGLWPSALNPQSVKVSSVSLSLSLSLTH